ncbi:MAG: hypothetical protein V3R37_02425 [Rhodospirillales bacterium]
MMKRRRFLSGAVAAAIASSLATPALAQNVRQLNMVTAWPRNFLGLGTGGDALTCKIYENFIAFRKKSLSWSHLAEQSYWNARILPFKY